MGSLREICRLSRCLIAGICFWLPLHAQTIHYRVSVHAGDTTGYDVEMRLQQVPHRFRLAMATHHEYDDRFWRYLRNFRVEAAGARATAERTDSAVYDISIPGDQAVVSYTIQLPPHRFAHQPFLSANGGLFGDIHSFFYLVGHTNIPATVGFDLPAGWKIATGLEPTADRHTFRASSAKMLMDCPVLAGNLRQWHFIYGSIPYSVSYLPVATTGPPAFDTALLAANIKKIVGETISLFGSTPYRHYDFLLVDGVYGALEHANSVTIGAPAAELKDRLQDIFEELAHEFFHTWNLVDIVPAGYTDLNYGPQERSGGLWFSEGVTMLYADLLVRRAGLPCEDSTRLAHLSNMIRRYYADTGNTIFSPAAVSLAANAPPGALGDYSASTHVQGELIGALLDMLIRSNTGGRRSLDDVMRLMYRRFGGRSGFYARDVEQAVTDAGGGAAVRAFFDRYVYQGKPLDVDPYLRLLGLRLQLGWQPVVGDKGVPVADTRIYIWQPPGDSIFHLILTDPRSCWGRAGLHTGDAVVAVNDRVLSERASFYTAIRALKPGDTVTLSLRDSGAAAEPLRTVVVPVTGYQQPNAGLLPIEDAGAGTLARFREWAAGLATQPM
jgi:predicted metalloprotease with PDZ domain